MGMTSISLERSAESSSFPGGCGWALALHCFLTSVVFCAKECDEDVSVRSCVLLVPSLYGHWECGRFICRRGVWRSEWWVAPPKKEREKKCAEHVSMFMLPMSTNHFTCRMCCSTAAFRLKSRREASLTSSSRRKPSVNSTVGCLQEIWGDLRVRGSSARNPGLTLPG